MIGAGNLKTNKKGCCVLSLCHSSRLSLPFLSSLLEFAHRLSTAEDLPKEAFTAFILKRWSVPVNKRWLQFDLVRVHLFFLYWRCVTFRSASSQWHLQEEWKSLPTNNPSDTCHLENFIITSMRFFLFRLMFFSWNRSFFWAHFKNT